jgi:hypothetical protein
MNCLASRAKPAWRHPSAAGRGVAIKINGVRSYRRVRAGQTVELSERPVTIRKFDLLGRRELEVDGGPCVDLSVVAECSSGTYVRALARDLGAALGSAAHLTRLRRTGVGAFHISEAQTPEEAEQGLTVMPLNRVVRRSFATQTIREDQNRLGPPWSTPAGPQVGRSNERALNRRRTGCCCRHCFRRPESSALDQAIPVRSFGHHEREAGQLRRLLGSRARMYDDRHDTVLVDRHKWHSGAIGSVAENIGL